MKRDAQPNTAEFRKVRAQAVRFAEHLARLCQDPAANLGQLSRAIQSASMSANVLGVHVECTRYANANYVHTHPDEVES
jgi:broad specificity phosphatase PhoE